MSTTKDVGGRSFDLQRVSYPSLSEFSGPSPFSSKISSFVPTELRRSQPILRAPAETLLGWMFSRSPYSAELNTLLRSEDLGSKSLNDQYVVGSITSKLVGRAKEICNVEGALEASLKEKIKFYREAVSILFKSKKRMPEAEIALRSGLYISIIEDLVPKIRLAFSQNNDPDEAIIPFLGIRQELIKLRFGEQQPIGSPEKDLLVRAFCVAGESGWPPAYVRSEHHWAHLLTPLNDLYDAYYGVKAEMELAKEELEQSEEKISRAKGKIRETEERRRAAFDAIQAIRIEIKPTEQKVRQAKDDLAEAAKEMAEALRLGNTGSIDQAIEIEGKAKEKIRKAEEIIASNLRELEEGTRKINEFQKEIEQAKEESRKAASEANTMGLRISTQDYRQRFSALYLRRWQQWAWVFQSIVQGKLLLPENFSQMPEPITLQRARPQPVRPQPISLDWELVDEPSTQVQGPPPAILRSEGEPGAALVASPAKAPAKKAESKKPDKAKAEAERSPLASASATKATAMSVRRKDYIDVVMQGKKPFYDKENNWYAQLPVGIRYRLYSKLVMEEKGRWVEELEKYHKKHLANDFPQWAEHSPFEMKEFFVTEYIQPMMKKASDRRLLEAIQVIVNAVELGEDEEELELVIKRVPRDFFKDKQFLRFIKEQAIAENVVIPSWNKEWAAHHYNDDIGRLSRVIVRWFDDRISIYYKELYQ
ncbi:MAG: hypothetical protein KGZ39_02165 [Simkania sp.]|nr:hypothetical protein [Simkania sp.]